MDGSAKVAVIGAGTMGSGIAQVAAQAGHTVMLFDNRQGTVDTAINGLRGTFDWLVAKNKLTADAANALLKRIEPARELKHLAGCSLVIEAIIEVIGIKRNVFSDLEIVLGGEAVLATNTSSLSVTAIAAACAKPERVIGLHFFNPAPLLPLVEVVPGLATGDDLPSRMVTLMKAWGKTPVMCKDTPGFIVNRVARPFYGEAIRIYEEGIADIPTIDAAMKGAGFRMGPFELMDLIGNDINYTVTRTVWEAFHFDPRYKPSFTQQRQVESGRLGRKTGRGYYGYDTTGAIAHTPTGTSGGAGAYSERLAEVIVERILAMLINEAAEALFWQVSRAGDIDLALTKGVNYPKGLLAWADEKGAMHWLAVLERLQNEYGEDRYRPSPMLRRRAAQGVRLSA